MKAKKKICDGCEKERYIWKNSEGNRYCQQCWNKIKYSTDKPTLKRSPISPRSSKRINLDNEYSQLRKIFLNKHPMCQAAMPGLCTQNSTDVHHKKGRGKYYLVVDTWMSVCRSCHMWIEEHPIEATDLGFRESKITD